MNCSIRLRPTMCPAITTIIQPWNLDMVNLFESNSFLMPQLSHRKVLQFSCAGPMEDAIVSRGISLNHHHQVFAQLLRQVLNFQALTGGLHRSVQFGLCTGKCYQSLCSEPMLYHVASAHDNPSRSGPSPRTTPPIAIGEQHNLWTGLLRVMA